MKAVVATFDQETVRNCRTSNFAKVRFQLYFLGGEFSSYGVNVISFVEDDPQNRADPMSRVFPRMTKCVYQKYGPSGQLGLDSVEL